MIYYNHVVFVFGSNLAGIHGAGAAHFAHRKCGAKWGQGVGLAGNSYAIPTKDENIQTMELDQIRPYIHQFIDFAHNRNSLLFFLTPIGCGLAGHKQEDIMGIIREKDVPMNVVFSKDWRITC